RVGGASCHNQKGSSDCDADRRFARGGEPALSGRVVGVHVLTRFTACIRLGISLMACRYSDVCRVNLKPARWQIWVALLIASCNAATSPSAGRSLRGS